MSAFDLLYRPPYFNRVDADEQKNNLHCTQVMVIATVGPEASSAAAMDKEVIIAEYNLSIRDEDAKRLLLVVACTAYGPDAIPGRNPARLLLGRYVSINLEFYLV